MASWSRGSQQTIIETSVKTRPHSGFNEQLKNVWNNWNTFILCQEYLQSICRDRNTHPVSSLQTLCDIGKSYSKGLNRREGILEVQSISVAINPSELHDLERDSY